MADFYADNENLGQVIPIHEELSRAIVNEVYRTEPLGENARIVKRGHEEHEDHDWQSLELCKVCGVAREVVSE